MTAQLALDLSPRRDPVASAREWVAANPAGWRMFLAYARELTAAGRHFSAKLIAERVRYECALTGVPYKLDNRIVSSLARMLIAEVPAAAGLIETRDGAYVYRVHTLPTDRGGAHSPRRKEPRRDPTPLACAPAPVAGYPEEVLT